MCSKLPENLVVLRSSPLESFKTLVGIRKEKVSSDRVLVDILSPTLFQNVHIFRDIYSQKGLMKIIMDYKIHITVPCSCKSEYRCYVCTIMSLENFEPVWDTSIFPYRSGGIQNLKMKKTSVKHVCNCQSELSANPDIHRRSMFQFDVPKCSIYLDSKSQLRHKRAMWDLCQNCIQLLFGEDYPNEKEESHPCVQILENKLEDVNTVRKKKHRRIRPTFLGKVSPTQKVIELCETDPLQLDFWRHFSLEDTSQWRRWKSTLKKKVLKFADVNKTKNELITESVIKDFMALIDALYTHQHEKTLRKSEDCTHIYRCPMCDVHDLSAENLNNHTKRHHKKEFAEFNSHCRLHFVRFVLLKSCFPGVFCSLAPDFLQISGKDCKCTKTNKKLFSQCILKHQRKYYNSHAWIPSVLTSDDVSSLPDLPLVSKEVLEVIFGKCVPDKVTETLLKSAIEMKFMPSVENNKVKRKRKRKRI